MSWLIRQFFPTTPFGWASMLVQALAWPASAVVIAAMFRAEVRLVVERLVRLKFRSFEAQFHRELAESEGLADQAEPKRLLDLPSESRRVLHEIGAPAPPLAAREVRPDPRARIEEAWSALSGAADRAAGTIGVDPVPSLAGRGLLSGADLLLFDRLRRLRAQVAGAAEWGPSADDADRYDNLVRTLVDRFSRDARIDP